MILSETEKEVCGFLAKGYQVKEIADMTCRSPHTIDTHIKNVKKKNSLSNIADIVREFILSLDEPKKFFKAMVVFAFITAQGFVTFCTDIKDIKQASSMHRYRNSRTVRRNTNYLT
ncbi:helix-turn-helix transcriptional regulator [Gaetbulibacter sp. PBL-D1]|uniref:helix-turn-helix transcriptional regulator n=1 Tax=Gaetbulibacter sp. PBL-D1 TaxID=3422594 RepID=UPI003D2EBF15